MKQILKTYLVILASFCLFFLGSDSKVRGQQQLAQSPQATQSLYRVQQKLTSSNGASGDTFGSSVAISGDTAVVGAPLKRAVYVFVRSGTTWTQQAILTGSDSAPNDYFGNCVSIAGNTIIVGAPVAKVGANIGQGAAYIYTRNGTTWTQQTKLTASDGAADDNFGFSVAIGGGFAYVGAPSDDIGATSNQGSAYAFVLSGTIWSEEQKLFETSDGTQNGNFGYSVALSGTTAVVGSHRSLGSIYLRTGNTWNLQKRVNALSASVSISGDTAVFASTLSQFEPINIYVRSGTTWTYQQALSDPENPRNAFGISVSISGNTLITGATSDYFGGTHIGQNSAYVYTRSGTTWTQKTRLIVAPRQTADAFGVAVGVSSTGAIIVGAGTDNIGGIQYQGSAYVFTLGNAAPFDFDNDGKTDLSIFRPMPAEWWINRSSNSSTYAVQFGASTDTIVPADYTNDGKSDVAFWRSSTGQWFILRSEDSTFYGFPFGISNDVPIPADYDGDGRADVAVFRPSTLTWYISKSSGGTEITNFGAAGDKPVVADYDGDGKADIAIYRTNGGNSEWWIRRSSNGAVTALQFGLSTDKAVQGDYTGDGKADVAVFRPSNGNWSVLRSEDFSFYSFPFGSTGDLPTPGDYDGDGKIDAAVFRASGSTWFANSSSGGTLIQQFGATGDKPLPNAFVP